METPDPLEARRQELLMQYENAAHRMYGFLDTCDEDQLGAIAAILNAIIEVPVDRARQVAAFWNALVNQKLAEVQGKCMACGKDHDAELDSLLDPLGRE